MRTAALLLAAVMVAGALACGVKGPPKPPRPPPPQEAPADAGT